MSDAICRDVFRGHRLALQVLDRDSVRGCFHQEPHAVISITDPHYRHPVLADCSYRRSVLRMQFSDLDERAARLRTVSPHVIAFTSDMAGQVAAFVGEQVSEGTRLFVVHCEAGISRSAGIATALSRFYNHDETFFLVHYRPNVWVRRLMLEALASAIDNGG